MTKVLEGEGRKPRADAARNRESLIAAAKQAFAEHGSSASLEEIRSYARRRHRHVST